MRYNLDVFRSAGRAAALQLRAEASEMTGTQIIDREQDAPMFDPEKDYSSWPAGSPVRDGEQVWILLQPYNAAIYPQRPAELRALWGLAHTTDPEKAKPWVDPYGVSGLYMLGECYVDADGVVRRCVDDYVDRPASILPDKWEVAS